MTRLRTTLLVLALAACGAADTADTLETAANAGEVTRLEAHVETHPSQGTQRVIDGGRATAVLSDRAIAARFETSELSAGHVYTMWLVAVNRPERCATSPCKAPDILKNTEAVKSDVRWAAGGIAGADGTLTFEGRAPLGRWSVGWFGNGITNPEGVEIHLVINDHGPAIPGREVRMKTTYREGCTDESLPPPFPAIAKRDGEPGPNRCALVQDAIFVQAR